MQPRDRYIQDGLLVSATTTNKAQTTILALRSDCTQDNIFCLLFLIAFSISATPLSGTVPHSIKRYTKVKGEKAL